MLLQQREKCKNSCLSVLHSLVTTINLRTFPVLDPHKALKLSTVAVGVSGRGWRLDIYG